MDVWTIPRPVEFRVKMENDYSDYFYFSLDWILTFDIDFAGTSYLMNNDTFCDRRKKDFYIMRK